MLLFSISNIHEYKSCLDILIFNCKYFRVPERSVFYRPGLYFSILRNFLGFFHHLVVTFLICFSFVIKPPKLFLQFVNNYIFALVCKFYFFEILNYCPIINFIVIPAVNLTGKIGNYCYTNFSSRRKNLFTTIIISSAEKKNVLSRR